MDLEGDSAGRVLGANELSVETVGTREEFLTTNRPRVRQFLERTPDSSPREAADGFAAAVLRRIHHES
jgi:hypothetical protein